MTGLLCRRLAIGSVLKQVSAIPFRGARQHLQERRRLQPKWLPCWVAHRGQIVLAPPPHQEENWWARILTLK